VEVVEEEAEKQAQERSRRSGGGGGEEAEKAEAKAVMPNAGGEEEEELVVLTTGRTYSPLVAVGTHRCVPPRVLVLLIARRRRRIPWVERVEAVGTGQVRMEEEMDVQVLVVEAEDETEAGLAGEDLKEGTELSGDVKALVSASLIAFGRWVRVAEGVEGISAAFSAVCVSLRAVVDGRISRVRGRRPAWRTCRCRSGGW
jgi:hypothetical protein